MAQTVEYKFKPHKYQLELFKNSKRFNVLVCHRRFGKTVYEINRLILSALNSSKGNWRGAYIAPQRNQAKTVAWDYLKEYSRDIPGTKINESELRVDFPNGARIQIYGGDNPDALRGIGLDGAVLDEVAQMKAEVWDEIIAPAISDKDREGWVDFIGTPQGINKFYSLYQLALEDDEWHAAMYRITDTGEECITKEELARRKKTMSEAKFEQEFMCDFNSSSEDVFIPLSLAHDSMGKGLHISNYHRAPKVMGIDIGRDADDTVICKRQGLAGFMPIHINIPDNMIVASKIAFEIDEWQPDAVFIDQGAGVGVIDRLRSLNYKVVEVPFNSSADDSDHYLNKRAEMYGKCKEWLKSGGVLPTSQKLLAELTAPCLVDNISGKIQLEKKKHIKDRLGRSPDEADAFVLTFAHSVRTKETMRVSHFKRGPVQKADPHRRFRSVA